MYIEAMQLSDMVCPCRAFFFLLSSQFRQCSYESHLLQVLKDLPIFSYEKGKNWDNFQAGHNAHDLKSTGYHGEFSLDKLSKIAITDIWWQGGQPQD